MATSTFAYPGYPDYPIYIASSTSFANTLLSYTKEEDDLNVPEGPGDDDEKRDEVKNNEGETIEETESKNEDAAAEAREGEWGQRSYASPDFGKDDEDTPSTS